MIDLDKSCKFPDLNYCEYDFESALRNHAENELSSSELVVNKQTRVIEEMTKKV
jgi:hypothetical protein